MARRQQGTGRAQTRARQLRAAAAVDVPERADVCVVGGGAAGLTCAIVAAERGARVVVLEREPECGRTILATGNGRCNFANARLDPSRYNDPAFVGAVCGASWLDDVLAFFQSSGLAWVAEAEGRLYPISRQAASVRSVLLARARRAHVTLAPAREVRQVSLAAPGFEITFADHSGGDCERTLAASAVVWAVGGRSAACLQALDTLGLSVEPAQPVLCPLACDGPALDVLDGRRVHAVARLVRDGNAVLAERGEVLFRPWGLSGIVVFDLSRHARPQDVIALDLIPDLPADQISLLSTHTLDGLLDPVVAQALCRHAGSRDAALLAARDLRYRVTGPAETSHAQVARGGLQCEQFSPATLEARALPGVFACGEALDVDGPCGGFNLAWAWKSGMVAGATATAAASKYAKSDV